MDDQQLNDRPTNPRRRRRTRQEIFKENYLPTIIACCALLLIVVFIIGSITRGVQRRMYQKEQAKQESIAAQEAQEALDNEAASISAQASALADRFDYQGAIGIIDSFSGDLDDYPELAEKKTTYEQTLETLILWDDPAGVLSLSLHVLIEDPQRAFTDATYGSSYNRNFITTGEFRSILQQLYENGYILVSLDAIAGGESMALYLPEGKKPLLLTQTHVNYYNYMTDSDGDKLADSGGDGFASRLILDANGNIACEMVDSQGQTVTGAFDLVPILESFIETHPDFSYCNAKAVLAVTGYDGIFGYRTNPEAREYLGDGGYQMELDGASQICEKLQSLGYELACYTYNNEAYGYLTVDQIHQDLEKWNSQVMPIMGAVDTLVFAQGSDIDNPSVPYSDDKYQELSNNGFTRYLGFCEANESWCLAEAEYFRQGRIQLTGATLAHHGDWFEGIFDAATVLDPLRGEVPN